MSDLQHFKAKMSYLQHLKANWKVAGHSLLDFLEYFLHGLCPAIKWKHKQGVKIMQLKALYQCEICNTTYEDYTACKKCEESHKKVEFAEAYYLPFPNNSGFPIKVRMEADGVSCWYLKESECEKNDSE